jgi:hypothetical protein
MFKPSNAIDGRKTTSFVLQPNVADSASGFWKADFVVPSTSISRIQVATLNDASAYYAKNAKVYAGEYLCGTLPSVLTKNTLYTV